MEKDKRILCYYIISFAGACTDFDLSKMTDDDVIKSVKNLEKLTYDELLTMYDYWNNMFIEKFGFNKGEF